jgi:isopenicillin N synthase-like dioxygenase
MNVERVSVPYFTEPRYECLIQSYTPNQPENMKKKYADIKYGEYIAESNKQFKEYQR